jgi:Flp pilus assembly protein TadB
MTGDVHAAGEASRLERPEVGGLRDSERRRAWIRGLFMLLFAALWCVGEIVVLALAVLQLGFVLFAGEPNARLQRLGASLAEFLAGIVRFWTFATDRMPFPFSDWPVPRIDSSGE